MLTRTQVLQPEQKPNLQSQFTGIVSHCRTGFNQQRHENQRANIYQTASQFAAKEGKKKASTCSF